MPAATAQQDAALGGAVVKKLQSNAPPDLPHNLEAEQAVLGAILIEEAALGRVAGLLKAEHFYLQAHQVIFRTCAELAQETGAIDPVLLHQRLEAKGLLGAAVPRDLPFALAKGLGTASNVFHYAGIVAELAQVRRMQLAAQRIAARGYEAAADVPAFLAQSQMEIHAAATTAAHSAEALSLADVRDPPRESFVLGNMIPFGKVTVLYGPTSVGKSALVAQINFAFSAGAESLWGLPLYRDPETEENGGPVLIYTAEDTLDDWKRKGGAVLMAGGIDVDRALSRLRVIDQTEGVARLTEAVTIRSDSGDETITRRVSRPTAEQNRIISEARRLGARLIVIETASRLVEEEDNANFSALQSALGRIARETGAAVLVTHHVTKAASAENNSEIESARGGGALVANARNALSLFPAEPNVAKPYRDRFPADEIVTLAHQKATSSTRRGAPITLVRTGTTWGAVFRLPDEVARSPEEDNTYNARLADDRERQACRLRKAYDVVAELLPGGAVTKNRLRSHKEGLGLSGEKAVDLLVDDAITEKVLTVEKKDAAGRILSLGLGVRP